MLTQNVNIRVLNHAIVFTCSERVGADRPQRGAVRLDTRGVTVGGELGTAVRIVEQGRRIRPFQLRASTDQSRYLR